MRTDKEKALVDAIIDGHIDAKEVAEAAAAHGLSLGRQLTLVAKGIFQRAKEGKMDTEQARRAYRQAYLMLSLAGFAHVAQRVLDVAESDVKRVKAALKNLGKDVTKVAAIRKIDRMGREAERANGGS